LLHLRGSDHRAVSWHKPSSLPPSSLRYLTCKNGTRTTYGWWWQYHWQSKKL
jgi:hypothetical protein